jgi:hypothetical protein
VVSGKNLWLRDYYFIITPSGSNRCANKAPSPCVEAFIAMPFDMPTQMKKWVPKGRNYKTADSQPFASFRIFREFRTEAKEFLNS